MAAHSALAAERPRTRQESTTYAPPRTERWLAARRFETGVAALALAVILTRVPFVTQTLYAFDSANYALAVRDFYNVAFHQPHPPGYPLYVFFARALSLVVNDANRALILEGIVWSVVAVVCTAIVGRAMFGAAVGLVAAMLLTFTVGFWGYGEVAYPYVALAGETALLACLTLGVLQGHRRRVVWLGLAWAVSLGVRWDGAVFCGLLWLWALWRVSWRLRLASVALAAVVVAAWAVPMVQLSGGWDTYREAVSSYLQVWSPQSAFVVGDFNSGGDTQANYNLNFLVNYLRQMLGVGLVLVLYVFGRRFGPAMLASDQRSRFLLVWVIPPLLVYVFTHLGEPGYVLSLAPQAALLVAIACFDLGDDVQRAVRVLRARGVPWLPNLREATIALLAAAILGWNVLAFLRGVGPGRLPDLRAHDATTALQVAYLQQQPAATTMVLAHDIFRQLAYYAPGPRVDLLYSEYVPDFQNARTRTGLPTGTEQVVILDEVAGAREVVLSQQPRVSVWVLDARGAHAVEHGYRFASVLGS